MITVISVILNPSKFNDNPISHDQVIELKKEMGRLCDGIPIFLTRIGIRPGMTKKEVDFMERYLYQCGQYEGALKLIINTTPFFAPTLFRGTTTVSFDNSYLTPKCFDLVNIHIAKEHIVYEFVENIQISI